MKRTTGAVAMLSVAALLLSACGNGDDDGDAGAPAADTADETAGGDAGEETDEAAETDEAEGEGDAEGDEEEAAPVRDENAELVIWADDVRAPILTEWAEQFGEEYGITTQVQVSTDTRQQFKDASNVDQGPDIVVGAHDWLGEFVQDGIVSPVQMSADVQAQFAPEALEATQFDGQIYGVPYATESLGLIRNTDLAPDAPATMEELVATGQELVDAGDAEQVMVTTVGQQGDAYHAFPYLAAYGGGIFGVNEDGGWDSSNVIVGSEESIQGGEKIAWLAEEGALNVNVDGPTMESLFNEGATAFMVAGPWAIPNVEGAGINYEISPIPDFEDGGETVPFLGVQMFYVSANAKNANLAQEFVNTYATTEDMQLALFEAGQRPPALTAALDTVSADDADIEAWATAGEGASPMPNIPAMNAVWGPLGQATADIVSGDAPADRLAAAQQEIEGNLR
jgi:arabinogalactan oligomer / maltooligosaccharide transport system substrate-binding protein